MPIADTNILSRHLRPLSFKSSAYDPILKAIGEFCSNTVDPFAAVSDRYAGNAQVVLIGDGSHGTYEFYAHRANITQRLIEEKGFTAVAVEADWPDAFRINRHALHRLITVIVFDISDQGIFTAVF